MPRNWDDDLDDLDRVADMFDRDPHTVYVTVWIVDDETDAEIISEILEDDNIVAMIVAASEAGEYASLGHPDSIHVQVSKADADVALEILQSIEDLPGSSIVLEDEALLEEDESPETDEEIEVEPEIEVDIDDEDDEF
ncbi:MAG: hypothetical protein J7M12_04450 [Candidatus Hydrogenedentes bacterium]|nr:hypothetical protein [Candidatus Hydrogenedentota bacterium]